MFIYVQDPGSHQLCLDKKFKVWNGRSFLSLEIETVGIPGGVSRIESSPFDVPAGRVKDLEFVNFRF